MCVFGSSRSKRYSTWFIAAPQTRGDGANRTNMKTVMLFRSEAETLNSGRSLVYARGNKSTIFSMIYASQKKYTSMPGIFTHLQIIPQQSIQNKLAVINIREKLVDFCNDATQASTLALTIILQT